MAATSGADAPARSARAPLAFGRIVVIGGGCYGSWYTGQLARAFARGALTTVGVVVVDRDPACRVVGAAARGEYGDLPVQVVTAEWGAFLERWLGEGSAAVATDTLVPSPLMPHLLLEWLLVRAQERWPGRALEIRPLPSPPAVPWERGAPDGRHYVSFATWMCPVNCIEPAKCPATRGPRDWSMPVTITRHAATAPAIDDAVIFHCEHRTYGVGMIDASAIVAADDRIALLGAGGPVSVLVGTVSHCHGALGLLHVD